MKSLPLKPDDAILLYTWQYDAVANTCEMVAKKSSKRTSALSRPTSFYKL